MLPSVTPNFRLSDGCALTAFPAVGERRWSTSDNTKRDVYTEAIGGGRESPRFQSFLGRSTATFETAPALDAADKLNVVAPHP